MEREETQRPKIETATSNTIFVESFIELLFIMTSSPWIKNEESTTNVSIHTPSGSEAPRGTPFHSASLWSSSIICFSVHSFMK